MGQSKRTRRGIATFNRIQSNPKRFRYHAKRTKIGPPPLAPNIFNAAMAAAEALNASVQIVPDTKNDAESKDAEVGPEQSVPTQSEGSQVGPQSADGGQK